MATTSSREGSRFLPPSSMLLLDIGILGLLVSAGASSGKRQAASGPLQVPGLPDPAQLPPQCGTSCTDLLKSLFLCSDLKCFCVDATIAATAECLQCIVDVGGSLTVNQQIMNQVESSCSQRGFAVTQETLSVAPILSTTPTQASPPITPTITTSLPPTTPTSVSTPPPPPSTTPIASPTSESSDTAQPTDASPTDGVAAVPTLGAGNMLHPWSDPIILYLLPMVSLLSGLVIGTTRFV